MRERGKKEGECSMPRNAVAVVIKNRYFQPSTWHTAPTPMLTTDAQLLQTFIPLNWEWILGVLVLEFM